MAEEISEDDIPSSSSEAKMFRVTWPTEAERTEEMVIVKKKELPNRDGRYHYISSRVGPAKSAKRVLL